jgi:hypothetical protein
MIIYLNWQHSGGRETVDELSRGAFDTQKEFVTEIRRLCREYTLAGVNVYISKRACANWKD